MKRIYSISTALTFVCATSALAVDKAAVLDTYANIAAAKYQDSLVTAQTLQAAVNTLVATPSAEALQNAKEAWLAARIPYQQTLANDLMVSSGYRPRSDISADIRL